jgi:hypothetical protein
MLTPLRALHEIIMDISKKRFGAAVREVFGGNPPERDRKIYLSEFETVLWPEFDPYQYLPIRTLKELAEQSELELFIRATRLLEKEKSVRTPTEFVQLCTDFLQLFNLDISSDYSMLSQQKPYSRRDLHDALKSYLY